MKRILLVSQYLIPFVLLVGLLGCSLFVATCSAGPNAGGVLLVHYRAGAAVPASPTFVDGALEECEDLVTEAPAASGVDPILRLWCVYAAFPPCASPRVARVSFGCAFREDSVGVLWTATRPNAVRAFYPGSGNWPHTGSGVEVEFEETLTDILSEIYCFAGYGYAGATFSVGPHPNPGLGGRFVDDGPSPHVDAIAAYGNLGFGISGSDPSQLCYPCLPPVGACCRAADGSCAILPESACLYPDLFLGGNTSCNRCFPPGACCRADNTCVYAYPEDCEGAGEQYWGLHTACTPDLCSSGSGACCTGSADHECLVMNRWDCANIGGIFRGVHVECDPDPCPSRTGACCNRETGSCALFNSTACEDLGTDFSFTGEDTDCDPSPCSAGTGACCVVEISGSCEHLTLADCEARGGAWKGIDAACDPEACPADLGACCRTDETCVVTLESECAGILDARWNASQPCTPVLCETRHACCTVWINGECALVTRSQCSEHGGLFFPDVDSCDPDVNPCHSDSTLALGACCIESEPGECVVTIEDRCSLLGGFWSGNFPCSPERCDEAASGACCYVSPAQCQVVSPGQCRDAGALYFGDGVPCDPGACPENLGACCRPSDGGAGICVVTTAVDCVPPGAWRSGIACTPGACPADCCTPIEIATWGSIKARYRRE